MNEREIFARALELKTEAERAAFLDEACGDDAELRRRIEELLREKSNLGDFLEVPVTAAQKTDPPPSSGESPGDRIGPYKLLQKIGEGGMGAVYMAEQTKPVRRRVALKVIKAGMDTQQVVARFEAERQALAMMDHPNIAQVLDAGATDTGRPYFVMELVKGVPLTQYCDEHQLTPKERLELFLPVCQAIQHAHQKGIIHRDLKPSNVLVAEYDDRVEPKVIDFGVAKALHHHLTEKTLFTEYGQIVGTLEYMSPEQAKLNQMDIDTRSDIYSLGVLLYELLTGSTPFQRQRLRSVAFDEMLRIIREEEPPRLSLRLSTSEALASIAANRRIEPQKLSKLVHGELDWIVMKTLDKERSRRYETANGLARDLQRYLRDEAVEAGPPSVMYRLRKFTRKNRKLLSIATAFLVILLAGSVISTWQAIRASREATRAREQESQANAERDRANRNAEEARRNLYIAHMQQIQLEWDKNNIGRIQELLDRYRSPDPGEEVLRGWEWRYWDRMCHLDLRTLRGHEGAVNCVEFNPDGSLVASGGVDGMIRVWETGTGRAVRKWNAHQGGVTSLAFHPDGHLLASGGHRQEKLVKIWNTKTWRERTRFVLNGRSNCLAFSPNGKLLAVGTDGGKHERIIWNIASGKVVHPFVTNPPQPATSMTFNRNSSKLICTGPEDFEVWDLVTDDSRPDRRSANLEARLSNLYRETITSMALSPDGKTLASGDRSHKVKLWDAKTLDEIRTLTGHTATVTGVAFSPDGKRVASSSGDGSIKIWDLATSTEIRTLRGHTAGLSALSLSSDGTRIASASADGTVKIWDANSRMDRRSFLVRARGHYSKCAFSPDGRRLAVSGFTGLAKGAEYFLQIRDTQTCQLHGEFHGHSGRISGVAISPDQKWIATGSTDQTIIIRDFATGEVAHTISTSPQKTDDLMFSPNGRFLLASCWSRETRESGIRDKKSSQRIYEVETGRLQKRYSATSETDFMRGATFSPNDCLLAIPTLNKTIRLVEPSSGAEIHSWSVDEIARQLRFSPNGRFLGGRVGRPPRGRVVVWDSETGSEVLSVSAQHFGGFDADSSRVFSWDDLERELQVWHLQAGDLLCTIKYGGGELIQNSAATQIAFKTVTSLTVLNTQDASEPRKVTKKQEAQAVVAHLLRFPLEQSPHAPFRKTDLLERIRQMQTISDPVKKRVLTLVKEVYTPAEEANQFVLAASEITVRPGATPKEYRQALEWAQMAYDLLPPGASIEGMCWCDLGMALYRNKRFAEALDALKRGYKLRRLSDPRIAVIFLCYIAMAHHQLGHEEEARSLLKRLRDPNDQHGRFVGNTMWGRPALREAVNLIEGRKGPEATAHH